MGFLKKSKSVLGLDIGVSSIKIIELALNVKKEGSLINLGTAPIEVVSDDKDPDAKKKAIVKAINNIITTKKIKTRRVISGLLGQSVFIRMVNMPKLVLLKMKKEQIIGILKTEIEAEIPFPVEEATIDFFYHGEIDEERTRKYKITVVVIPNAVIQEQIAIIREANLCPVIIDTATFALCRAYRRLVKEEDLVKTIALIEISATTTEVNIIQEGNLQLTRSINLGGNNLTQIISETLNISFEEAEKKKREENVLQVISLQLEKIAEEIRSSFKYYQLQMHQQVEKIVLCGGGAKLKGVLELLHAKLELPVERLNPLENIRYDGETFSSELLEDLGPSLGVCVGLALRNIKEERAVNFLPFELWERSFFAKRPFLCEGIFLAFLVATLFMVFSLKLTGYTKKFDSTETNLKSLNPQDILGKLKEMTEKKGALEGELAIVNKLTSEKMAYSQIISGVVDGLPSNVWLTSLSIGTETIILEQETAEEAKKRKSNEKRQIKTAEQLKLFITGSSLNTQSVASFMLYLKNYPNFKDVNLNNLQQVYIEETLVMNFIVECAVK